MFTYSVDVMRHVYLLCGRYASCLLCGRYVDVMAHVICGRYGPCYLWTLCPMFTFSVVVKHHAICGRYAPCLLTLRSLSTMFTYLFDCVLVRIASITSHDPRPTGKTVTKPNTVTVWIW